jgi:hypothetical protein
MRYLAFCVICYCITASFLDEATGAALPNWLDKEAAPTVMEIAGGKVVLEAPPEWKKVNPRFPNMVQYEFNAPKEAAEGEAPVRVTVMASGGGVQGNLERWYGQFSQPDGRSTKDVAKIEEFEVDGVKIYWVKITGTYSGGMMGGGRPAPAKENHQLMSGIIVTPQDGMYFVTATGPIEECEKLSEGFKKMLEGLKAKL